MAPTAWLPQSTGLLASAFGETNMIFEIDPQRPRGGELVWSGTDRGGTMSVGADGSTLLMFWSSRERILSLVEPGALSDLPAAPTEVLTPIIPGFVGNTMTDLSPDGRWLTYHSPDAGAYHVYAVRTDSPGERIRISDDPGEAPLWSPDGDGVYFRYGGQFFWAPFDGSAPEPFGRPVLLLEGDFLNVNGPDYAVAPDGDRLLLLRPNGNAGTAILDVTLNFRARLKALLGEE